MTTNPMTNDMRIVATAYRQEMLAGGGDLEGYRAALDVYLDQHPEKPRDIAGKEVRRLIYEASAREDGWIYGKEW
jgi:hypothetical protein